MSDEDEDQDEVNTQKKSPVKDVKKKKKGAKEAKEAKEAKKKVTKKAAKKKANKKKKRVAKGVIEDIKRAVKDGKVCRIGKYETAGLFGVTRGNVSLRAKKKPVETGLPTYLIID